MYIGIPNVILKGKVIANAIGTYKLGLDFGAANFIAAGTAIYDPLPANKVKRN
jgi:hypothetical protein